MSDAETIRMLVFYRKANCMRTTGKKLKFTASRMGEFIGWKPWQRVLMELLAEKYEEYAIGVRWTLSLIAFCASSISSKVTK